MITELVAPTLLVALAVAGAIYWKSAGDRLEARLRAREDRDHPAE